MGVVLTYPGRPDERQRVEIPSGDIKLEAVDRVKLGVVGAGNFASVALLPAIKGLMDFVGIASERGVSARAAADRFGFRYCTTNTREILNDPAINAVALLTRHNLHAAQVVAALDAGKHVFVEKPMCLTEPELESILAALRASVSRGPAPALMVGFNRRFAPFVAELVEHVRRIKGTAHAQPSRQCRIHSSDALGARSRTGWRSTPRRRLPLH